MNLTFNGFKRINIDINDHATHHKLRNGIEEWVFNVEFVADINSFILYFKSIFGVQTYT